MAASAPQATTRPRGFGRLFGDLRVRPKLIVLHNLFFLVLAGAIYFTLIPRIEERTALDLARETVLMKEMFARGDPRSPAAELEVYQQKEGSADELAIPEPIRVWLDANPGAVWEDPAASEYLYRKDPESGRYTRLTIPVDFYGVLMARARGDLFLVLGAAYLLAVGVLEFVIIPRYVYRPIRVTLEADEATRQGDREQEIIDPHLIPGDEIGDIMRSRNKTVSKLRDQEAHLERALKRLEELARDLQRKNDMLEAAKTTMVAQDRLVSLGLLSASVAHELNTPLTVLHGSIEKLLETVHDPAAQQRLERTLRVAERLRTISVGLLDFSRQRREETEPLAVRPLIDEAWALVAIDERAAAIEFSNRVDAAELVAGNHDRLMQVFVNLLRNAIYAIENEGHIVVHAAREISDGRSCVTIAVDDDGLGIPEDVLPNIFEAFVTSRLDSRGTGLGLTVAEGIVHQHGGTLTAYNRPEGGARLEVKLPAAGPAQPRKP
jgi:signal transduction histidine kinase